MEAAEVRNSKTFFPFGEDVLLPQIIGCVSYFFPPSPELHRTFLSYYLINTTKGGKGAFPINVPIPPNNIRADKVWIGVPAAD
jgi:hypothetical protein